MGEREREEEGGGGGRGTFKLCMLSVRICGLKSVHVYVFVRPINKKSFTVSDEQPVFYTNSPPCLAFRRASVPDASKCKTEDSHCPAFCLFACF